MSEGLLHSNLGQRRRWKESQSSKKRFRRAYTLLELTVVMTLLCLVVMGVSVRLAPAVRKARAEHAVGELLAFEQQIRTYCRKSKTAAELNFDLDKDRVLADFESRESRELSLAKGIDLKTIHLNGDIVTNSTAAVYISQTAESPTYVVEYATGKSKPSLAVLFAGVTGQAIMFESAADVQRMLKSLQTPRSDTD